MHHRGKEGFTLIELLIGARFEGERGASSHKVMIKSPQDGQPCAGHGRRMLVFLTRSHENLQRRFAAPMHPDDLKYPVLFHENKAWFLKRADHHTSSWF